MHAMGVWQVNKLTAALCRVWLVLMNETLARLFFVQQSFIFYPKRPNARQRRQVFFFVKMKQEDFLCRHLPQKKRSCWQPTVQT